MPIDRRSAGRLVRHSPGRAFAGPRRAWRRRSRRAQVSAVAVILGLLVVVTFIANYLSTTLPNTMAQNDLQHEVQVENQVASLSAVLQAVAKNGVAGAQVSQPITLGSLGSPPFAPSDGSSITPGNASQGMQVNFTVAGPLVYTPVSGGPQGGPYNTTNDAGCVPTPPTQPTNSITCSSPRVIIYNFTGALANQASYSLTLSGGGTVNTNILANLSTITITGSSNPGITLLVIGNNDSISVITSSVPEHITIVGNYDTLTFTGSGAGTMEDLLIVGNHDTVNNNAVSGTTEVASIYGSSDAFNPGTVSSSHFNVYFNGYNPLSPASTCPVDNLSSSDTVGKPTASSSTFAVTYNNTVYSGTGTVSGTGGSWGVTWQIPAPFACPYVFQSITPIPNTGLPQSASFVTTLFNTYAPTAQVAFDQGAVVYVQPGGGPVFVVPPRISFVSGTLTVFLPRFEHLVVSEGGTGVADVSARLIAVSKIILPGYGVSFQNGSQVTITIVTPYAAAWNAYLQSYTALAPYATCTGANNVCSSGTPYKPGASLGTITIRIPTSGIVLQLLSALYDVTIS